MVHLRDCSLRSVKHSGGEHGLRPHGRSLSFRSVILYASAHNKVKDDNSFKDRLPERGSWEQKAWHAGERPRERSLRQTGAVSPAARHSPFLSFR